VLQPLHCVVVAVPSAAQQTNSIEDLFSEFEAICFSYGEKAIRWRRLLIGLSWSSSGRATVRTSTIRG
jgi:hypothetical protein